MAAEFREEEIAALAQSLHSSRTRRPKLAVNAARKGKCMKTTLVVLAAFCGCAQGALAAGPDCRAIEKTSERLACSHAAPPAKKEKPVAAGNDASRAAYKDPFVAEDAQLNARLKNICRGC